MENLNRNWALPWQIKCKSQATILQKIKDNYNNIDPCELPAQEWISDPEAPPPLTYPEITTACKDPLQKLTMVLLQKTVLLWYPCGYTNSNHRGQKNKKKISP